MAHKVTDADYRALAEFRYRIRLFLEMSEIASRSVRLEPEQYQLLLAVRGMPRGREATIQALAEQLRVRHNTVVERVDRLAHMGLLHRTHSSKDRRVVLVHTSPRGIRILEKLAAKRLFELRCTGPGLIAALAKVISATRHKRSKR
ncbi:MAG TPA: MarR family transcriptional regulator [Candidatus Acidoferrum sp.]|nr:MarR family transcriptional regulator [Candidatus Acidoferrum sp.]